MNIINIVFVSLSSVVAIVGIVLAIYYACTIRKKSVDEFLERPQSLRIEDKNGEEFQGTTGPIKVFIYLDEDKMYSLSSQLFEGITNEILSGDSTIYGNGTSQKGAFASGSFMANMMFQQSMRSESRSLNDFAFTVFEDELIRRKMIYCVDRVDKLESLKGKGFVKISGKIAINDYSNMLNAIDHFNDIGKAVGYFQHGNSLSERQLKDEGLFLEKSLQENVKNLISFGYKDRLEIVFSNQETNLVYSTTVNRKYLKDSEGILISRYSCYPEKFFSMVGIISQIGEERLPEPELDGDGFKKNIRLINSKTAGMENSFNARATNECIIDPIAIFTEIPACQK